MTILTSLFAYLSFLENSYNINNSNQLDSNYIFSNNEYCWPTPGFHTITSKFGPRTSPTSGASSNHSGIDIAASEGTAIYSVVTCEVTFIGFKGAGGYTIITESSCFTISYCHVSPNYIVNVGDIISIGEQIGNVGPKYVYDVINNPYKDSSGNPTNGATTGCHLHLTIRKNGTLIDPLSLF